MNKQNLEYFLIAAKEGNITRAAQLLNISQQALSGNISRLESELGAPLFERRPEFTLTYAGKCFLKTATSVLDIMDQGQMLIDDISGNRRGELKIGVSHTRGQAILPLILPEFSRQYPDAELSITEATTKELENHLDKGSIDIMIGFLPKSLDSAAVTPLVRERLFLVLPKSLLTEKFGESYGETIKKYEDKKDISVFRDMPFVLLRESERIRSFVDNEFRAKKISPRIRIETYNIQTAFSLATEGMGIGVCPETYLKSMYTVPGMRLEEIKDRVLLVPFFSGQEQDTICIAYNRERYLSNMARDFIDTTVKQIKSLGMDV